MQEKKVLSKQAQMARRWIRRNLHHIAVAKVGGESSKIKNDHDAKRLMTYARKCARVLMKEDVRA
jgi:hypothetical protein